MGKRKRHSRTPPATFAPALDRGETAPFPCWPTVFGLILHRQVPRSGPPWRTDPGDCWAVSDGITGYGMIGFHRTPLEALRALHHGLRSERRRSGRPYSAIVADARRRIV